ncbi:MAG: putative outerrane protein (modular protein) [Deltaproteobacteria bacterium]|nr:putative outerrane protein (modular protein) [Deltaproteobacteria bacterium]
MVLIVTGMTCNTMKSILRKGEFLKKLSHAVLISMFLLLILSVSVNAAPFIGDCQVLPSNNIWNTPVDKLPVDLKSSAYISSIGANSSVHPDFGSGNWNGGPIGIPLNIVLGTQPMVPITFDYDDESDPGPYPIPQDPSIEGGEQSTGDRHVLVFDTDNCILYETFSMYPDGNGGWNAGSGAIFNLSQNGLRPSGWTSADAAGLPILPGLVKYDEVASGEITHAIRFTAPRTRRAFVWPARHYASSLTGLQYPPMGQRFRLKANFDESGFSPHVQVILRAMKRYGLILADNGSSWYVSGVPDERWDNDMLVSELRQITGSDFEAVDVSSLMVDENSGEAMQVAYLTLARSGDGKGTLTAKDLSCLRGGICTGTYNMGEEITITANPHTGSVLAEWNGCTSTNGNVCTITMSGDVQITGTFLKRPIITASPRTINFGVLGKDITSPPRVVTIQNKGSAPLIINSSEITGTNAHELEQANGCTNPLSHDATCTIIVTATPISSGKKAADLVIHSNDTKKPSFRIKLRAKAK